ncbi:MAG: twin-arginine translocase subunit TatC [Thermaerobacterales bacterium]
MVLKRRDERRSISPEVGMSFVDHLTELRRRLILIFVPWVIFVLIGLYFAADLMLWLIQPALGGSVERLAFLAPGEAFLAHLRLAFYLGTVAVSPVILYQAIAFLMPALSRQERRMVLFYLPFGLVLFTLGAAFGFFVILPLVMRFFLGFAGDQLEAVISISSYLGFVMSTVIPFGVVFQLPVITLMLAGIGLIDDRLLRRVRKTAVLVIFIVSAALTPPDIVSQLFMAAPLLVLYEISIWLAKIGARGARARARSETLED